MNGITVTARSVDPVYGEAVIDVEEERAEPVPHRYVHGHFAGTEARFSFYFPPPEKYEGRFIHNTYPMAVSADIGPFPIQFEVAIGDLGFTVASGAYYVQTNNGGLFRAAGVDPAIAAYRVNAAAAKFSRTVAARIYGEHRSYGYLFGGSGGAYQTMGAAEATSGVWDGFLPFVPGCNHAIPSMFTVRMHALRVLRRRDRLPGIADALAPGGSGDPYANLDAEEVTALREVTRMGFPPRAWYRHAGMDSGYFANISGMIPQMDPGYAEDFWSQPGYLGADPDAEIRDERFAFAAGVAAVSAEPPWSVTLDADPARDCANAHLVVLSGAAEGASLPLEANEGARMRPIATADATAMAALAPGDRVCVDNSWALALETYHRHQVPPEREYYAWDQFREGDGAPIPPQRTVLVGPTGTANAAGAVLTGAVNGKVLVLAALMDIDAYPWQADWYRSRVAAATGADFDDRFALWFIDRAHHENPLDALQRAHVVSFSGALQQGLRDLAKWVEHGVKPAETHYRVEDTQVIVPGGAAERGGIQPVVELSVNGADRAEVAVGEPVTLTATIATPPGAGQVVSAAWDFEGTGTFADRAAFAPAEAVALSASHAYARPGTYFAALTVSAQREGDADTPYAQVRNLAQARVVVR
ncbi:hypothetical protein B2G71_16505 [Novosphingobium sp. PC22D]|uniref:PKD domain-containing protein n=1 Tax=Novosphingobium sp. PC22D TaxID=1962403 RepID=UPI000BF16634|nr:PKD domain-containing protein [Novosphingobium sp. PC22D]PEQ11436.1 hypothetical protein B2G71_16505 [Novosphingobium sp. PC22D]